MSYTVGEFGKLHPTPVYGWNVDALDFLPALVDVNGQLKIVGAAVAGGGDASAANQVIGNLSLASIDTKLTSPLAVSAASLPLPTLAATSTIQATQQTALDAIKTAVETIDNFISGARGLVTEDNSGAIKTAVETIDNFIVGARGLVTEDNSAAILTRANLLLADATFTGRINTQGQKTSAASTPVVLASDALPPPDRSVTGTITALSGLVGVLSQGTGTAAIALSGTWVGTIGFYGLDPLGSPVAIQALNVATSALEGSTTTNGVWLIPTTGVSSAVALSTAWTSGTASVGIIASPPAHLVALGRSLPTGTNSIGQVTANAGSNLSTALLALESGNLATIILRQDRDYRALTEYVVRALLDIRTESRIQTEILFDGFNLKGDLLQYRNDAYYSGLN